MSSTRSGEILEREIREERAWCSRSAAAVSLKPPRPPLVMGVRRQQVTTMSSGDLAVSVAMERGGYGESWLVMAERRA